MKKKIFVAVLTVLLFAVAGISFSHCPCAAYAAQAEDGAPPPSKAEQKLTPFAVYYFHGTRRCFTCRKIEANTRDIINTAYAKDIADKKISFTDINTEEKENKHFIADFGLVSSSVVLVERGDDGKVKRFKILPKVWMLVKDDAKFKDYILDQTKEFMECPWL